MRKVEGQEGGDVDMERERRRRQASDELEACTACNILDSIGRVSSTSALVAVSTLELNIFINGRKRLF